MFDDAGWLLNRGTALRFVVELSDLGQLDKFRQSAVGLGQAPVKSYNRKLCQLIAKGRAKPSFLVSHELPLPGAPDAYRHFDAREDGWTKVVLQPVAGDAHMQQGDGHGLRFARARHSPRTMWFNTSNPAAEEAL